MLTKVDVGEGSLIMSEFIAVEILVNASFGVEIHVAMVHVVEE